MRWGQVTQQDRLGMNKNMDMTWGVLPCWVRAEWTQRRTRRGLRWTSKPLGTSQNLWPPSACGHAGAMVG